MLGISIAPRIGVGDKLQFSSLPENYFRATGKKLVDTTKPWFFDHNPYVVRDVAPEKTIEMWNFGPKQWEFPKPRPIGTYLCNAEIWAQVLKVPMVLNRPRLYRFEDYPFEHREAILLHTHGRSHGTMPEHIIEHVLKKYRHRPLFHVGLPHDPDLGIPKIATPNLWDLAEVVSQARIFIGVDSGPGWVAACYPDVIVKKVRTKPTPETFKEWVPLEIENIHSHWDDRLFQTFNPTKDDIGFTQGYLKI